MAFGKFGARGSKFGASWVTAPDGTKFASKGEYARWQFLCDMQACGKISNLRRQITYKLEINGQLICKYIADFLYICEGKEICSDFKGMATPEFLLKKKMMLAIHGIDILVVKKPTALYK